MTKKRILFVDDETNIIEGLQRMLRKERHEWDMAFVSSGAEALAKLDESSFDVIVTDMHMPGMNGAELLEQVIEKHPDVARIVLTGYASEESTNRALRIAHQVLSKPTDAETLKKAVARACPLEQIVRNSRVRAAVATCESLPSLPFLYVEIRKAAESETASASEIARIISRDMSMSAKLLQLVNSSFFGIGRRVSSIEQTVALLGNIRIKALVLMNSIFKELVPSKLPVNFSVEHLWDHSLAVAEVARLISKAEKQGEDRPDQAFTAGLLHDVGMLVFAWQHTEVFGEVLDKIRVKHMPVCLTELDLLSVTHAEIGSYLLGLWGLPPRIVEAVALHHNPNDISYDGLCAVTAVHVADALVSGLGYKEVACEDDSFVYEVDMSYIERIGLAHRLETWKELAIGACEKAVVTQV